MNLHRLTLPTVLLSILATALPIHANTVDDTSPASDWPARPQPLAAPAEATITAAATWRLACGEDAETVVGRIVSAVAGTDGRILLADQQLGTIHVVGPDGRIERSFGRNGEGPGEFHGVWRVVQRADGRVGVVGGNRSPLFDFDADGWMIWLDDQGDPAGRTLICGDMTGGPMGQARDLRLGAERLLLATHRIVFRPPAMTNVFELALIDPDDGAREVLATRLATGALNEPDTEAGLFEPWSDDRCDIDATGRVAFGDAREQWRVAVREPDGSGYVITRPLTAPQRSAQRLAARREELGLADDSALRLTDTDPVIARIRWRPSGRLWVEPSGGHADAGALTCFDEFAPDGELLRRVHLVVPDVGADARLVLLGDGRGVLLEGFGLVDGGAEIEPEVTLLTWEEGG
jgi:hypothetical protein